MLHLSTFGEWRGEAQQSATQCGKDKIEHKLPGCYPRCSDPMVGMSANRVAVQLALPLLGNLLGDPLPQGAAVFVYWAIESDLVTTVRQLCGPLVYPDESQGAYYPDGMLSLKDACNQARKYASKGTWSSWQSNPFPAAPVDSDIVKDFCGCGVGDRNQAPWRNEDSLVMLWQFGLGGFARLYLGGGGSTAPQDLYHYVFGHGASRCSKSAGSQAQAGLKGASAGAGIGALISGMGRRPAISSGSPLAPGGAPHGQSGPPNTNTTATG